MDFQDHMSDDLITRLDRFVISLLDEAERQDCGNTSESDTSEPSEEGPGTLRPVPSLLDRIATLKVATAYLNIRSGKAAPPEPEEPPEIDGFVTRIADARSRKARGRSNR